MPKQPDSTHQPTLVEDRIEFDGNDILQVRDDALRHSSPGIIVVAKWDASVSWGNTIAGYHGESGIGWKLRQYSSSFDKLTFTSFGTTGDDNPNPSQTTTQSDYFICSSFREDGFRYLRHNGEVIIKFEDKNYINYPGSDYGKSGIGGYFRGYLNIVTLTDFCEVLLKN